MEKEIPLSRRGLLKYIIYTTVGCSIAALLTTAGTAFPFYYKTNNNIENLIENDKKQDEDIKEITSTLDEINDKLGGTSTVTSVSDVRINNLDKDVGEVKEELVVMRKDIKDILKIVGEIKRNQ